MALSPELIAGENWNEHAEKFFYKWSLLMELDYLEKEDTEIG